MGKNKTKQMNSQYLSYKSLNYKFELFFNFTIIVIFKKKIKKYPE